MATLHAHLRNELSEIPRLAALVEEFCARNGVPGEVAFKLNIAFDELITNTVSYGYDGEADTIDVDINLADGWLTVRLSDGARPHDPFEAGPPSHLHAALEDRPIGGLGVHLVKSLVDRVHYARAGTRNVVELAARLPTA